MPWTSNDVSSTIDSEEIGRHFAGVDVTLFHNSGGWAAIEIHRAIALFYGIMAPD